MAKRVGRPEIAPSQKARSYFSLRGD